MTLLTTLALLKLKSSVSSDSIVLRLQSVTTPLSSNLLKQLLGIYYLVPAIAGEVSFVLAYVYNFVRMFVTWLLTMLHYKKMATSTAIIVKLPENAQWLWVRRIKFARWQHPAMEHKVRFVLLSITCYYLCQQRGGYVIVPSVIL